MFGEIVRSSYLPLQGNNKHALPKTGNVLQDFAQIGNVHSSDGTCGNSNSGCTLKAKIAFKFRRDDRGE